MRKVYSFVVAAWAFTMMGCFFVKQLPLPLPGIYPIKTKTLTYLDLASKSLNDLDWNTAELTESRPEGLTVAFDYSTMKNVQFGRFQLGNREQKVWFLMAQDDANNWSEFYIDQNLDMQITAKERVKSIQSSGQDRYRGIDRQLELGLIPVSLEIPYKGSNREFEQNLYFFIGINTFSKKDLSDIMVGLITASFLEGDFPVTSGRSSKSIRFRILDANGNGCFNDYGTDLVFMDLNGDSYFEKNESQSLKEFFVNGSGARRRQYEMVVPPFPVKLGVYPTDEEYDSIQLEPSSTPSSPEVTQKSGTAQNGAKPGGPKE